MRGSGTVWRALAAARARNLAAAGEAPPVTVRAAEPADCTVRGGASDVYLALWNRQGVELLEVGGDARVLALFRDNVKVRWS